MAPLAQDAESLASRNALKAVVDRQSELTKLAGRKTASVAQRELDDLGKDILNFEFKQGERAGQTILEEPGKFMRMRSKDDLAEVPSAVHERRPH